MKVKRWVRKARTIVVHLEGPGGIDLRGDHVVEIRDAKNRLIRNKVLKYRNSSATMSVIMSDVQSRLSLSALVVDPDSYRLTDDGNRLRAAVSLASKGQRHPS
jgi:hypothetical protein